MFDSHCHLDFPEIAGALPEELVAARKRGIDGWIIPGCYQQQWKRAHSLWEITGAELHNVYLSVGQHPAWAAEVDDPDGLVAAIAQELQHERVVAIGECGLDRYSTAPLSQQCGLFEAQLRLAQEREVPVVLHQVGERDAFLRSLGRVGRLPAGGVVHGYGGDLGWAQKLVALGFSIGVGPAITRPSRARLREAVRQLPLNVLLLETDGPDQAVGHGRGGGKPVQLEEVCRQLALLRGDVAARLGEVTSKNTIELFRLSGRFSSIARSYDER